MRSPHRQRAALNSARGMGFSARRWDCFACTDSRREDGGHLESRSLPATPYAVMLAIDDVAEASGPDKVLAL
jgi:hypothetical protein